MKLSDFDYRISKEHIAQHPLTERDSSKLFVIHRDSDKFEHRNFKDIVSYLKPGDILILNDTKVFPARLFGVKPSGGKVEILLLKELRRNKWDALVKGLREGKVLLSGNIIAHVSGSDGANARVEFKFNPVGAGLNPPLLPDIKTILHKIGVMPLPPYIKRQTILLGYGTISDCIRKQRRSCCCSHSGSALYKTASQYYQGERDISRNCHSPCRVWHL